MALLLRDVVGLSYNEIADSLEVTLATVKWRIFKAREDVQVALAREGITFGEPKTTAGSGSAADSAAARPRGSRACCAGWSGAVRRRRWRPRAAARAEPSTIAERDREQRRARPAPRLRKRDPSAAAPRRRRQRHGRRVGAAGREATGRSAADGGR